MAGKLREVRGGGRVSRRGLILVVVPDIIHVECRFALQHESRSERAMSLTLAWSIALIQTITLNLTVALTLTIDYWSWNESSIEAERVKLFVRLRLTLGYRWQDICGSGNACGL